MARLRRASPHEPGIRRRRRGRGFSYVAPTGEPVRDPEVLERIRRLAIPPAWTDVWICPFEEGHLQAVGTDAAGRGQCWGTPAVCRTSYIDPRVIDRFWDGWTIEGVLRGGGDHGEVGEGVPDDAAPREAI